MKRLWCVIFLGLSLLGMAEEDQRLQPWESSPVLRHDKIEYAAWLPLRMRAIVSERKYQYMNAGQDDFSIEQARRLMENYDNPEEMLLVRGPFGRLVIGAKDGLIHGMRPRLLAESYGGSYLREYAENWPPLSPGLLQVKSADESRINIVWKGRGTSRSIGVFADGRIETEWKNGPKNLEVFTGAHPYHYIGSENGKAVRFSQMIEKERPLDLSRLALFGYRDASLVIECDGIRATREAMWTDHGDVAPLALLKRIKNGEPAPRPRSRADARMMGPWFQERYTLTYLSGGFIRKISLEGAAQNYRLNYRIGEEGIAALNPGKAPEQTINGFFDEATQNTLRVWPNRLHGWKLRPTRIMNTNPQPVYYGASLKNPGTRSKTWRFSLKRPEWMQSATLQVMTEIGQVPQIPKEKMPVRHFDEFPLAPEGSLTVPAGESRQIYIKVQPQEETLGAYDFSVKWQAGNERGEENLQVRVVPTCFMENGSLLALKKDDFFHFGMTMQPTRPAEYFPAYYDELDPQKSLNIQRALNEDSMRGGRWLYCRSGLRHYIQIMNAGRPEDPKAEKFYKCPPETWLEKMRDCLFESPTWKPYNGPVCWADEVWEVLGRKTDKPRLITTEIVADRLDQFILTLTDNNAVYFSFMQHSLDNGLDLVLPCDFPVNFYYSGMDEMVYHYMDRVVQNRQKLVDQWLKDPAIRKSLKGEEPRTMTGFWVSAIAHISDYAATRRQCWHARAIGMETPHIYWLDDGGYLYGNTPLHLVFPVGEKRDRCMPLDRFVAVYDVSLDFRVLALARFLAEQAGEAAQENLAAVEEQVFELAQANQFDEARQLLLKQIAILDKDYADFLCPDLALWTPVPDARPLPDFSEQNARLKAERQRKIVLNMRTGNRPAPEIDGTFDNVYLEEGAIVEHFDILHRHQRLTVSTTAYLAWDRQWLYVLFDCQEPKMSELKTPELRDGPDTPAVFGGDCVELFLMRPEETQRYFQFGLGAGGAAADLISWFDGAGEMNHDFEGFNSAWQHVAVRKEKSWLGEMRIPWTALGGTPKPGETWKINFTRTRRAGSTQQISWAELSNYHTPSNFGEVQFIK